MASMNMHKMKFLLLYDGVLNLFPLLIPEVRIYFFPQDEFPFNVPDIVLCYKIMISLPRLRGSTTGMETLSNSSWE